MDKNYKKNFILVTYEPLNNKQRKGGVYFYINYLITYLKKDYNLSVIYYGDNNKIFNKNNINYIEIKNSSRFNFLKILSFQVKVFNYLKKNKINNSLINFQETTGFVCALFNFIIKKNNKIINTFHHHNLGDAWWNFRYSFYEPMCFVKSFFLLISFIEQYICLMFSGHIITVSKTNKKFLKKIGFKNKDIVVINHVIKQKFFEKNTKKNYRKKIIYIGELEPRKNILLLIKAIKKLDHNYELNIVGDGILKKYLNKYITKNKLKKRVILNGFVSEKKKRKLLSNADVFILPSMHEGFGIVVLEAAACKIPILLPDTKIFKEIFSTKEVNYFKKNNLSSLVREIKKIFSNYSLYINKTKYSILKINKSYNKNNLNEYKKYFRKITNEKI